MADQSTFDSIVKNSDFGQTHTPAGLDELHQLQAQRYLEQQIAQGSQQPPSWPEQQAAQARQQQQAADAARQLDAQLRARQQPISTKTAGPPAGPQSKPLPSMNDAVARFYGKGKK